MKRFNISYATDDQIDELVSSMTEPLKSSASASLKIMREISKAIRSIDTAGNSLTASTRKCSVLGIDFEAYTVISVETDFGENVVTIDTDAEFFWFVDEDDKDVSN